MHINYFESPICILGCKKRQDTKGRNYYTFYYKSDENTYNCVWWRCPVELKETIGTKDYQWLIQVRAILKKSVKNGTTYYNWEIVSAQVQDSLKGIRNPKPREKKPEPTQEQIDAMKIENYKPTLPQPKVEPSEELVDVNEEFEKALGDLKW